MSYYGIRFKNTPTMKKRHEPCSRLIYEVLCDNTSYILLVENKDGRKGLPTAKIKIAETPQDAILRKLPQETGLLFLREDLGKEYTCQKDHFFCIKKTHLKLPKLHPKEVPRAMFVLKQVCEDTIDTNRQKKVFRKYIQESKV